MDRSPLHRVTDDRIRVQWNAVILMTLTERLGISRRHLLYVVTERGQFAGYIVRCHTGFDTDQASPDVRKSCANPAARDLLPQNDCAILIEANLYAACS
jgi:hypothetical protein